MNADLKKLIRLQAVDDAVREYTARTDAFPGRSAALDAQLRSAREGVRTAEAAIAANQTRRKELESRVADLETKISRYRQQLMSVKTNEEYRAMVHEIEFNQNAIRKEEDQILVLMEEVEGLSAALSEAKGRLGEDEKLVAAERTELEAANAGDMQTLGAYREERSTLAAQIGPDVLGHYERVRNFRGGVGVAPARDEACVICNVRMRPQIFQEVRKNAEIITCDSCGRILYDPENFDHPFEVA
jgi:predicted  nucleic acid-binding Zn-ribbon protein